MKARGDPEGLRLLRAVAEQPTPQLTRAFDSYFYPLVVRYVRKRRYTLTRMVGRAAAPEGVLPAEQLDESAHMTAIIALNRARASAKRFDPEKGTAEDWVLRSAAWAYQETVRELTGQRRKLRAVPTEDETLVREIDARRTAPDTFDVVVAREKLASVFELLSDHERAAVLLCWRDRHTHAEAAEIMFADSGKRRRVERLLETAAVKLRGASPTTEESRDEPHLP